ncbi:MAG: hypothetical protein NVV66_02690 [Cellulomonas sp.]|uniref:hypothetical protein n=1 Tax=Cellulomonas sp. TaxID=40001 RepID=UPI00258EE820|nr:hypothetical protein [Cellulomonas sp.]MCR6703632.1 hypothetical protein [Cellulomonas sp.]
MAIFRRRPQGDSEPTTVDEEVASLDDELASDTASTQDEPASAAGRDGAWALGRR